MQTTATAPRTVLANGSVLPRSNSLRAIGWAAYASLQGQGNTCPVALANAILAGCAGTAWANKPASFYAHRARRTLALYGQGA